MTDLIDDMTYTPATSGQDMDYEETLRYTQNMRKRMVDTMTDDGNAMPKKVGELGIVLQALDNMDQQTFKRREIETGGQAGGVLAAQVSAFMNELARSLRGNDPLHVEGAGSNIEGYTLPEPDDEFSEYELSQVQDYGKTNYDTFTKEFIDANPEFRDSEDDAS